MALKRCPHDQKDVPLFELRVILLGGRNSGKSFVGNTILNQEEFILQERTSCLKRSAQVRGRNVTVVDTPGWWCDFSARDTPELVRREIKCSVSLSLPGPHVFLLVIKTDSVFIEKRRRAVEEHLKLLGETVWGHTLVLLTKGKNSGDKSMEDHVKASGNALQWLLEKCSGRFHILDIHRTHNATQVMELMRKIYHMVEGNEGHHFEIDAKTLQEMEDRKRDVEIKAHQRLIGIQNQRATLRAQSCHLQNFRLVLLGAKGSGKSSTGNSILAAGGDPSFTTKKRTVQCTMVKCTYAGRQVTVVDTPGWWMNYFTQDSTAFDKQEIVNSVYLCPPGPHAFLLVVRVDRSFTEIYRRAIEEHLELFSKEIWRHTILLFTFGDWLGETTIEQHIESEGKALQWLVERCGDRYHVLNNKSPGNGFQITELLEKIEDMIAGTGMSHYEIEVEEIESKKQEVANRVKRRQENVLRKRQRLNAFKEHVPLPTITLILLGAKHSGKSSAARCILGNDGELTNDQKPLRGSATINEKKVEVVDTPGWTTEYPNAKYNRELLNGSETCVLLLVVNASSSFTFRNLRAAEGHLRALGRKVWSRTIVLFTNGDWLGDVSMEQHIESEGHALQLLVEKCENRYHVFNSKIKDDSAQVTELMVKIEEMVLEQMLNSEGNKGSIEHLLVDEKLQFRRRVQMGEIQSSSSTSSSSTKNKPAFGDTHISGEIDRTMTNSSLLRTQSQALACTGRLCNRNLPRRNRQKLTVVLNTSEWHWQNEFIIQLNKKERPEIRHELQTVRESHEGRLSEWPCLLYQRSAPHTGQTAKQRAFLDFVQSKNLQDLIDQWGDSNIEELEAFIDSYFEMVWLETMQEAKTGESSTSPINCEISGITESSLEYLASIDRKLAKLDILEDVQKDLRELEQNLKHFNHIFQELEDRSKEPFFFSQPSEATGSAESEKRGLDSDQSCQCKIADCQK